MPTMTFTTGDDTYTVPAGPGTYDLTFLAGADTLTVNGGDSVLAHMDDDNDTVTVNALNAAGVATVYGGLGDDTYTVKVGGVTLVENLGEGTDTVRATISWMLGANFENLTLTGAAAINGTGNGLANIISGNNAANTLDGASGNDTLFGNGGDDILLGGGGSDKLNGGTGADTMTGGTGNDTYYVDVLGDQVAENLAEGTDTVVSGIDYMLGANLENLTLTGTAVNATGNDLKNELRGDDLANLIDGGAGADKMYGGKGDDVYYVENSGDRVFESLNEGTDTVNSSVTFQLASNVENLTLTGSSTINGIGNSFDNVIVGNDAANMINGAGGADTMSGGAGNDTYIVDNVADNVVENASEGTDLVKSSVTFTLAANVENLTLYSPASIDGTGNELNNVIRGNGAANILDGGDGNDSLLGNGGNDTLIGGLGKDVLNGGAGVDTMWGGAGNDTYYVDNTGDTVNENGGEGTDTVFSTGTFTLGANVEKIALTGSASVDATGNELNNVMTGNTGNNILSGLDGNDTIDGAAGNDSIYGGIGTDLMTGGAGNDTFYFTSTSESVVGSADLITDFTSTSGAGASDDKLDFSGIDADTSIVGDQAFTWAQVTPTAHGIWIGGANPDGSVTLYGDVNGDTTPDFELHVQLTTGQLFTDDIVF